MVDATSLFCVDMGTTRTRAWLCEKDCVWAHVASDFGVRDVARGGTREELLSRLSSLLADVLKEAKAAGMVANPTRIAAAGMITSPLGVANLPHIRVPAGLSELSAAIQCITLESGLELPLLLVPGVITGTSSGSITEVLASDVMRGEEVLIIGMQIKGLLPPGGTVLNLGSHWKLIQTDLNRNVTGSRTTLTGEMIHAIQTQTLLASALPEGRPDVLDLDWLRLGGQEETQAGLSRALFVVRLLEQSRATSAQQRISFLYGAFIEAELRSLTREVRLSSALPVCLVGGQAVANAWHERLTEAGIPSRIIEEAERDASYLIGLQELVSHHASL